MKKTWEIFDKSESYASCGIFVAEDEDEALKLMLKDRNEKVEEGKSYDYLEIAQVCNVCHHILKDGGYKNSGICKNCRDEGFVEIMLERLKDERGKD